MDYTQEFEDWSPEKMREARHALEVMLASPGWTVYSTIAQGQIDARRNGVILRPLTGMDAVLEQEFAKGECAGLMLAQSMVVTLLEQLTSAIEAEASQESEDE